MTKVGLSSSSVPSVSSTRGVRLRQPSTAAGPTITTTTTRAVRRRDGRRLEGRVVDRRTSLLDSSTWAVHSSFSARPQRGGGQDWEAFPGSTTATTPSPTSWSAGSTASYDSFVHVDDSFFSPSPNPYRRALRSSQNPSHPHPFGDLNTSLSDPYLSGWADAPRTNANNNKKSNVSATHSSDASFVSPRRRAVHNDEAFLQQQRAIELQLQHWSFEDDGLGMTAEPMDGEFPNIPTELQSSFLNDNGFTTTDADASWSPATVPSVRSTSPTTSRRRPQAIAMPHLALRINLEQTSVSVASSELSPARTADAYAVPTSSPSPASPRTVAQQRLHLSPSSPERFPNDDSGNDGAALREVQHWRTVVAVAGERNAVERRRARGVPPSLADAWAQVCLGDALLRHLTTEAVGKEATNATDDGIHRRRRPLEVAREAQRAYQAAHRAYSERADRFPRTAHPMRLHMALCMDRLGAALVAEADCCSDISYDGMGAIGQQHHQHPLVRAYTVQLEAFRIRQKILGTYHVDTISSMHGLADLHQRAGDDAEAQRCRWQVYGGRVAVFGPNHPSCAVAAHEIGNGFVRLGALDDALQSYHAALRVYDAMELRNDNPAVRKLLRDVKRLERLERARGYNLR